MAKKSCNVIYDLTHHHLTLTQYDPTLTNGAKRQSGHGVKITNRALSQSKVGSSTIKESDKG